MNKPNKIHLKGTFSRKAPRIKLDVFSSACGAVDSLSAPMVSDAASVNCARCLKVLHRLGEVDRG